MNRSQVRKSLGLIAILAALLVPSLRATVTITSLGTSTPILDGQSMTLFVQVSYTLNFSGWSGTIDWGDGMTTATNASNASTLSSFSHTYGTNGPLVITLSGTGNEYYLAFNGQYYYPVPVSNPISNSVAITVLPVAPNITVQPQSQTILLTSNATFSATVSGSQPRFYQWYFNGAAVAGGTNSSLTVSNAALANSGNYQLIVTNIAGSATSSVAALFVLPPPGYSVNWFKVAGGGGTSTGGVFIVNGTFGQHDAGGPMQGGGYQATVGFWSLLGQQAAAPIIYDQPQSVTITNNAVVHFAVYALGTQPFTYQWRQNGSNITDIANFAGWTTSNLTVTVTSPNAAGGYSVVVANAFGSVTSSVAGLTLYFSPNITQPPTNTPVALGGTVTLSVGVSGTGPLTYQWLFNGVIVPINGIITTVAGLGGFYGYNGDNILATNAALNDPYGVSVDATGNVFIADWQNHRIRKVGTNGVITTVAGKGSYGYNGDNILATNAYLNYPTGSAVDAAGNLFIADSGNSRIRKVGTNGIITTVAGNGSQGYNGDNILATNASLSGPNGMSVDGAGNLFIADELNNRIRKVGTNGIIATVAGNGVQGYNGDNIQATNASLYFSTGVAVDAGGNLFIADASNHRIRKVGPNGIITTVAGNGSQGYNGDNILATNASLYSPSGVAVDAGGNLFIADTSHSRIRKVGPNGIITTVAGNAGYGYNGDNILATNAYLASPYGIAVAAAGNLLIADYGNNRVRKVTAPNASLLADGSLVLNNVSGANVGNYSVIITSAYGSVTSSIVPLALPFSFVSAKGSLGLANQQFYLTLTGPLGSNAVISASTNLQSWIPLVTNPLTLGVLNFTDTLATNFTRRFYRAALLP